MSPRFINSFYVGFGLEAEGIHAYQLQFVQVRRRWLGSPEDLSKHGSDESWVCTGYAFLRGRGEEVVQNRRTSSITNHAEGRHAINQLL